MGQDKHKKLQAVASRRRLKHKPSPSLATEQIMAGKQTILSLNCYPAARRSWFGECRHRQPASEKEVWPGFAILRCRLAARELIGCCKCKYEFTKEAHSPLGVPLQHSSPRLSPGRHLHNPIHTQHSCMYSLVHFVSLRTSITCT